MRTKPISPEAIEQGRKIRNAREKRDIKAKKLAAITGINATTLSFIERGYQAASQAQLRSLASALGLSFRIGPVPN